MYAPPMAHAEAEIEGKAIVLLGSFNPQIFQPAWFAAEGLISRELAENANIGIIHPQLVAFSGEWLEVNVSDDRFQVASLTAPSFDLLRDLALGTFRLLRHTPIRAMGLNSDIHYKLDSEESWHGIGHKLAPPDNWDKVLNRPGMRSLTIEALRDDDTPGYIRVQVEPSARLHPGLYVGVNDHFELTDHAPGEGATRIMKLLEGEWGKAQDRASRLQGWVAGLI